MTFVVKLDFGYAWYRLETAESIGFFAIDDDYDRISLGSFKKLLVQAIGSNKIHIYNYELYCKFRCPKKIKLK